jgi:hypothetical protein
MRGRISALEDLNPVDRLACLVLRVLAELSPCTERSLIECVSGGAPRSQPGQASHSHTRELVHSALLKLKALAFIHFAEERIAITDEGRRCLEDLPVVTLRQRGRSAEARDSKADHQVTTDYGEQDGIKSTTTSLSQLQARLWTRCSALLRVLVTTLRPEYAPRLKRFCQDRLAQVSAAMPQVCKMTVGRAWDTSLHASRYKVAPKIRSGATTLVHVRVQLAKVFCRTWEPLRLLKETGKGKIVSRLSKVARANWRLPDIKFAGFDLSRINYAGPLLLVCGALSVAGGVVFLSPERANSSRAEEAFLSGNRAGSSRVPLIVWLHDGQGRLGPSIFVTRRLAGASWIEGLALRGENASNQTLTGLQGAIKMDSGEEIRLGVNTEGNQGNWADAQDVPSGSKFTLKSSLNPDGTQTGMPAEEFLSKYGGMIFRVSYAVAGVQTTLIEYISTSKLRAQLADMN